MTTLSPLGIYEQRISFLTAEATKLGKKRNLISWARLGAVLLGILLFFALRQHSLLAAILAAFGCCVLFLRLLAFALAINDRLKNCNRLISINEEEVEIAAGRFHERSSGSAYLPGLHPYANDLDIFGRASLFQYICRASSAHGERILANWLLSPAPGEEILQRQRAVKELAPLLEWRQQLQSHGSADPIVEETEKKISSWLSEKDGFFLHPAWKLVRFVGPVIIVTIVLFFSFGKLELKWFNLSLAVFFGITSFISKKATPAWKTLSRIAPEVETLSNSIRHIEGQAFACSWLKKIQQHFVTGNLTASASVKILNRLLSRMDIRLNPVAFLPLNILFFWDLQQMLAFEKWKKESQEHMLQWFAASAEMEAISSLATLSYNHPDWCVPTLSAAHGVFEAEQLGHPLILAQKRVNSDFATSLPGEISVITGSNMAGKSTFLRSVGLGLVMGMCGAPVCAIAAKFSLMHVMSSMRISDNLEESTSTFYAELKKLKQIIEAVNRQEKVFLLLDEILRGTNSLDRHTGSKALIEQLLRQQAVGIIATHDLKLAKLVEKYPSVIKNYHFDVQVANDELYFDYKLKNGVCKSLNASILMKKIGIEM